MPMSCFWELSRNINRIQASNDSRALLVVQSAMSKEPDKYFKRLELEIGTIISFRQSKESIMNEKLDREGLQKLKTMSNIRR